MPAPIHVVPYDPSWPARFAEERADAGVAAEYAALKLALAAKYEFDREAYTDAKEPFVRRVLLPLT